MAFKPTKEQSLAIDEKGSIIVSAAAGSGKTAVLVERVAKLLANTKNKLFADKLLVVTYTTAAAGELRVRIEKRLGEMIANEPNNTHLQKQQILLANAKICTIDSFCIDFMRENFEKLEISPSFKIADKSSLMSLERKALSSVINDYFNSDDKDFLALLDFLGDDYDDSVIQKTVKSVFDYSRHMPAPRLWLKNVINEYKKHAEGKSEVWFDGVWAAVKNLAVDAELEIKQALQILEMFESPYQKYSANYLYFSEKAEKIISLTLDKKWDDIYDEVSSLVPPSVTNLTKEEKTEEVELSIKLRDNAKTHLGKIAEIVYAKKQDIVEQIGKIYPFICKIVEIVNRYEESLYEQLKENDLITFYIAEQTALNLLAEEKDGVLVPTENYMEFAEQYDAVMVDEYQDTNTLQDTLFNILSNNGKNLFCVGDMKQCIYKFRGSNPLNFLIKKQNSKKKEEKTEADMLRVDLGCNFRSRKEICDFVNSLFFKLIYTENSDFDYDEDEKLVPEAEYEDNSEVKVENHFVSFDSKACEQSIIEADAAVVGEIIEDLIAKELVVMGEKGPKKIDYSDIAILLHSMRGKDVFYINELQKRGIPVSVSASEVIGSDEVNSLISLLKVISNPSDDIALVTVLTSPIFDFSMDELAQIRAHSKYGTFYGAILSAAKKKNEKAEKFLRVISTLRRRSAVLPLGALIDEIFEETNLLNLYSTGINKDIKRLNLLSVQNLALEFDVNKNQDIRSFVVYFENLDNKDFSLSSASTESVKIMSIHKSKGLQFPVCILANTTNMFNEIDLRASVIMNEQYGFTTIYYDENGEKQDNNILRTLLQYEEKRNLLAEELRVLYVALTRAKEKLITISTYNDLGKEIEKRIKLLELSDSKNRIEYPLFRKNTSYADWLLEALILDGKVAALLGENEDQQIVIHNNVDFKKDDGSAKSPKSDSANAIVVEELRKIYSYKYPYEEVLELQAKASVTDIVHKADEKDYRFTSRPAFMQSGGLNSAERGTAIHKVMQSANYLKCKTELKAEIENLYENMFISEGEYEALDISILQPFFDSSLRDRIIASNLVKREMKFLTEFSAGEIMSGLSATCQNEPIVVQGAVDLLFAEDDGIVIVDFKSDRNKNESELVNAYEKQLKIYAKACSKLLNKPVKELIIYSFALGKEIIIK